MNSEEEPNPTVMDEAQRWLEAVQETATATEGGMITDEAMQYVAANSNDIVAEQLFQMIRRQELSSNNGQSLSAAGCGADILSTATPTLLGGSGGMSQDMTVKYVAEIVMVEIPKTYGDVITGGAKKEIINHNLYNGNQPDTSRYNASVQKTGISCTFDMRKWSVFQSKPTSGQSDMPAVHAKPLSLSDMQAAMRHACIPSITILACLYHKLHHKHMLMANNKIDESKWTENEAFILKFLNMCYGKGQEPANPHQAGNGDLLYDLDHEPVMNYALVQETFMERCATFTEDMERTQTMSEKTLHDVLTKCFQVSSERASSNSLSNMEVAAGIRVIHTIILEGTKSQPSNRDIMYMKDSSTDPFPSFITDESMEFRRVLTEWNYMKSLRGSILDKPGFIPVLRVSVVPVPVLHVEAQGYAVPNACVFSKIVWDQSRRRGWEDGGEAAKVKDRVQFASGGQTCKLKCKLKSSLAKVLSDKHNLHADHVDAVLGHSEFHNANLLVLLGNKGLTSFLGGKAGGVEAAGGSKKPEDTQYEVNFLKTTYKDRRKAYVDDYGKLATTPLISSEDDWEKELKTSLATGKWRTQDFVQFFSKSFDKFLEAETSLFTAFLGGDQTQSFLSFHPQPRKSTPAHFLQCKEICDFVKDLNDWVDSRQVFPENQIDRVQAFATLFPKQFMREVHKTYASNIKSVESTCQVLGGFHVSKIGLKMLSKLQAKQTELKSKTADDVESAIQSLHTGLRQLKNMDSQNVQINTWFAEFWTGKNCLSDLLDQQLKVNFDLTETTDKKIELVGKAKGIASQVFLTNKQVDTIVECMLEVVVTNNEINEFPKWTIPTAWTDHLFEKRVDGGTVHTQAEPQDVWESWGNTRDDLTKEKYQHQMATLRYLKMRLVLLVKKVLIMDEVDHSAENNYDNYSDNNDSDNNDSDNNGDEMSDMRSDMRSDDDDNYDDNYDDNVDEDDDNYDDNDNKNYDNKNYDRYKEAVTKLNDSDIKSFVKNLLGGFQDFVDDPEYKKKVFTVNKASKIRLNVQVRKLQNTVLKECVPHLVHLMWKACICTWLHDIDGHLYVPKHEKAQLIKIYSEKRTKHYSDVLSEQDKTEQDKTEQDKKDMQTIDALLQWEKEMAYDFVKLHLQWEQEKENKRQKRIQRKRDEALFLWYGSLDDIENSYVSATIYLNKYQKEQDEPIVHVSVQDMQGLSPDVFEDSQLASQLRVCTVHNRHANLSTLLWSIVHHHHRRKSKTTRKPMGQVQNIHFECALQAGQYRETDLYYVRIEHVGGYTMHAYVAIVHNMLKHTSQMPKTSKFQMQEFVKQLNLDTTKGQSVSRQSLAQTEAMVCALSGLHISEYNIMLNVLKRHMSRGLHDAGSDIRQAPAASHWVVQWNQKDPNSKVSFAFTYNQDIAAQIDTALEDIFTPNFRQAVASNSPYATIRDKIQFLYEQNVVSKGILQWKQDKFNMHAFWQFVKARSKDDIVALTKHYNDVDFLPVLDNGQKMSAEAWIQLCKRLRSCLYHRYRKQNPKDTTGAENVVIIQHNSFVSCLKALEMFDVHLPTTTGAMHRTSGWHTWLMEQNIYTKAELDLIFQKFPPTTTSPITWSLINELDNLFIHDYASGIDKFQLLQNQLRGQYSFGSMIAEGAFDLYVVEDAILSDMEKVSMQCDMNGLYRLFQNVMIRSYLYPAKMMFGKTNDPFSQTLKNIFFKDNQSAFDFALQNWHKKMLKNTVVERAPVTNPFSQPMILQNNHTTNTPVSALKRSKLLSGIQCVQQQLALHQQQVVRKHQDQEKLAMKCMMKWMIPPMQKSFKGGFPTSYLYNLANKYDNPWANVVKLHHEIADVLLTQSADNSKETKSSLDALYAAIASEILSIFKFVHEDSKSRSNANTNCLSREADRLAKVSPTTYFGSNYHKHANMHSLMFHIMYKYPAVTQIVEAEMLASAVALKTV
jgi:hypothetical protein